MSKTVVHSGETKSFNVGPPPGNAKPLNLSVETGGTATVQIAPNGDPSISAKMAADGGVIHTFVGSHQIDFGTIKATNGGSIDFFANPSSRFENDGTSTAGSGGHIEVPLNVIGQGLFVIDKGGRMEFASDYHPETPDAPGIIAEVAATQQFNVKGGTLVIDYLPGFHAPVTIGAGKSEIDINHLAADSATYDPQAHLVDFVGGGVVVGTLSLDVGTRNAVIAKTGADSFEITTAKALVACHCG